jgi:hypothetical protein
MNPFFYLKRINLDKRAEYNFQMSYGYTFLHISLHTDVTS